MVKKIEKKKIMIVFLCLLVLLAGTVVLFVKGKEKQPEEEEITLKEGQSFLYGQIDAIYGNEITYYLVEMKEEEDNNLKDKKGVSEGSDSRKGESLESSEEGMPGFGEGKRKERKSLEEETGTRKADESFEGSKGGMPDFEGGKPPMMSEGGMPDFEGGKMPGGNEMDTGRVVTKEKFTVQIPVGTQVTTRLGNVTTFSRLAAGDNIRMLVQEEDGKQVILKIWIVDET